jgi:hypothetical protein
MGVYEVFCLGWRWITKKRPFSRTFFLVPREGIEPSHGCPYRILSPARLPIPPPRHGDWSGI